MPRNPKPRTLPQKVADLEEQLRKLRRTMAALEERLLTLETEEAGEP